MTASVYLLHFTRPYPGGHNPQHYIGVARNVEERMAEHRRGNPGKKGSLMRAVAEKNIDFTVVKTWEFKSADFAFDFERKLKRAKHHARLCPICKPTHLPKGNIMAKRKQPRPPVETTVGDAVADGFSELESLGSELRDWYDNMPENLQGGSKGDQVNEAADTLEGLSEPDVPVTVSAVKINYYPTKGTSRPKRRDEAVNMLNAAKDALDEIEEGAKNYDEAQTLSQELDELINEADGVEFPGMFG